MASRLFAVGSVLAVGLLLAAPAFAQDVASVPWINGRELLATLLYGVVGIALAIGGFFAFELLTPFSVNKELAEDHNVAVGIVVGAMFIGIAIVVAAVIRS